MTGATRLPVQGMTTRWPVHRVLVRKYVSQSVLLWAACAIAMFSFSWVRVWVVSLLDTSQFQNVLDQFRKFERFAPIEFDALISYDGRVGMTFDEPVIMFCVVIWCIARGSDVVAGELGRGTLEMLLAQPIRRSQLLFSHAVVSIGGLALLCLLVWGGVAIGVQTVTVQESVPPPAITIPIFNIDVPLASTTTEKLEVPLRDRVDSTVYASSVLNLFAFGFFVLGLSTLTSSIDRYRWRAVGTVVTLYMIQLVFFGLGKAAESLNWLLSITFFSCYKPQKMIKMVREQGADAVWSFRQPLDDGLLPPMMYPAMLILLGLAAYAIATIVFTRRDLPAPL
jgi:ABC-2 type transport system permease protein